MKSKKKRNISDTNLLLTITIVVFFAMYIGAMVFQGGGFLKTQTFFNILNANAALLITSCGLSLVMITGGIDISRRWCGSTCQYELWCISGLYGWKCCHVYPDCTWNWTCIRTRSRIPGCLS